MLTSGVMRVMTRICNDVECIVVTYDSAKTIGACLRSLRRHCPQSHVTVVDNGSSDESVQLAEVLADRVVVSPSNLGYAGALNSVIEPFGSEYVLIVNPDLEFSSDLDDMFAASRSGVDVVGPMLRDNNGIQFACARRLPSPMTLLMDQLKIPTNLLAKFGVRTLYMNEWDHLSSRSVPALSGACLLLRRSVWHELGGMSEEGFMYFEDLDFFARLRRLGKSVEYVSSVVAFHHGGASSLTVVREERVRRALGAYLLFGVRHGGWSLAWRTVLVIGQIARLIVGLFANSHSACVYARRISWLTTVPVSEISNSTPLKKQVSA
jgi:GT2 family glycosyltransferase